MVGIVQLTQHMDYRALHKKIPFKFRVGQFTKPNAQGKFYAILLAYIDARDAMDLLDEVVGAGNWKDAYRFEDWKLICTVSLWDEGKKEWVSKEDTGTESNTEKEKGQFSDAFKRACVKWGIGRFLYSLDTKIMEAGEVYGKKYPLDKQGKPVRDLTKHHWEYITNVISND